MSMTVEEQRQERIKEARRANMAKARQARMRNLAKQRGEEPPSPFTEDTYTGAGKAVVGRNFPISCRVGIPMEEVVDRSDDPDWRLVPFVRWDGIAMSMRAARKLGIQHGDEVEVTITVKRRQKREA